MDIRGIPVRVSRGVAPNEVVLLGPHDAVRWTPDGGVEELSDYQAEQIRNSIAREQPKSE